MLAGASDIVLATENSYFGLPEIDRGALGGGAHLSRLFPLQAVRKMMFTGKPISAQRAYEYGSIESLHPDLGLDAATQSNRIHKLFEQK